MGLSAQLAVEAAEPTWENARTRIERAWAREHARLLASRLGNRGLPRPTPEILASVEPEEPSAVTLFDLVGTLQEILHKTGRPDPKHQPARPE